MSKLEIELPRYNSYVLHLVTSTKRNTQTMSNTTRNNDDKVLLLCKEFTVQK